MAAARAAGRRQNRPMKFLFVMDPMARLQIAGDSTFAIMLAAQARKHEIWFCEPRHLSLEHADAVARAWPVTVRRVVGDHYILGPQSTVPLRSCDAVLMRKDPPFDLDYYFSTLMLERARGQTLIVNDPRGLREHNEKLAVLEYPDLTPPSVVTRETTQLRAFLAEQGGEMVVKPLDASGGFGVFHVRRGDPNTGAILEQATNLGRRWTMAQRYLPEVRQGDKRILLVDGEPLCAVLRVPAADDARGNLHVGARPMATTLSDRDQKIVSTLGPKLRERGHFFVGLDVIGGWLTEINVTSPTGILEANVLYNDEYEIRVVEKLEEKIVKIAAAGGTAAR
jgi:glutathione synthase